MTKLDTIQIFYPDTIDFQPLTSEAMQVMDMAGSTSSKTAGGVDGKGGTEVQTPSKFPPRPTPIPVVAKEVIGNSIDTQSRRILSNYQFGKVGALQIGEYVNGSSGDIRLSPDGLVARNSAGLNTITIDGTTGNITILGTIAAGSAILAEVSANLITGTIVNAQIATIDWAKITNIAIVNADIVSLSASKITTGSLNGINIAIGSGNDIFKADSNGIYLGNSSFGSAPFRVNMDGDVVASSITLTNAQIGSNSTFQGNVIEAAYIGNLTTAHLTSGTITVGGTNQPSAIIIQESSLTGNARLGWQRGSRMWEDNSSRLGINSIGSPMFIYVASTEKMVIPSSGQIVMQGGISSRGNLNVGADSSNRADARFTDDLYLRASDESGSNTQYINSSNNDIRFNTDDNHEFYRQGVIRAIIDQNIFTDGDLLANGSKPFIVPHPDGSDRLLRYTAQESPDVSLRYRGVVEMESDLEEVLMPDHFGLITEETGMITVNLTPILDEEDNTITQFAVIGSPTNRGFKFRGKKGTKVMYELIAIRKGYLDADVEIDLSNDEKKEQYKRYTEKYRKDKSEGFQRQKRHKDRAFRKRLEAEQAKEALVSKQTKIKVSG